MTIAPLTHPANLATQCPLCGSDNRCAMEVERASGLEQPPCWCVQERFPPDLIARLPSAARGQACICVECLRVHAQAIDGARGAT